MKPPRSTLSVVVVASSLVSALAAQDIGGPWEVRGELTSPNSSEIGGGFGALTAAIPDLDNDGRTDFLIGTWAVGSAPTVGVFSSLDGSMIRSHTDNGIDTGFGSDGFAVVDDLDLDGTADYAIGATGTEVGGVLKVGSVYIYSGATGLLLHRIDGVLPNEQFGNSITGMGDVDWDGVPDIAIGAGLGDGAVFVCSGATGAVLYDIPAPLFAEWFSHSIASIGDLDADGIRELLVGAPIYNTLSTSQQGMVEIYSGADGSVLRRHVGEASYHQFGWDVCSVADLDGDGFDEYFIGARRAWGELGAAYLYSGKGGVLIQRFDGESGGWFGSQVADGGDIDGDGLSDLLVGCSAAFGYDGEFWALSGATGAVLSRTSAASGYQTLGAAVLGVGDQDGDGRADILVTDEVIDGPGRVRLLCGHRPEFTASTDSISLSAGGSVHFEVDFPPSAAGQPYRILVSPRWGILESRGRAFALGDDPLLWEVLATGYIPGMTGQSGVLDADGDATADAVVLPGSTSIFVGQTLYGIAVVMPLPRVAARGSSAVGIRILP